MSRLLGDDDLAVEGGAGFQRFLTALALGFTVYIALQGIFLVVFALWRYGWQ